MDTTNAVEFIKHNTDPLVILQHYNAKHITKGTGELRCCCPIHDGGNATAFVYNTHKRLWFCHTKCNAGGDIFTLVELIEKIDFESAVKRVAEIYNIDITNMTIIIRTNEVVQDLKRWIESMRNITKVKTLKPFNIELLGKCYPINSYRNFTKETLEHFNVTYCEMNQRIVVPITYQQMLVGVTMRRTKPHPIKWLHQPSGFATGDFLYNGDNITPMSTIIVSEGVFDVMNAYQCGYTNIVATFGCHLTQEQERMLLTKAYDFVIAYDNDNAGIPATRHVINRLQNKVNLRIAKIPDNKDLGELNNEEMRDALSNAYTTHEWRKIYSGY